MKIFKNPPKTPLFLLILLISSCSNNIKNPYILPEICGAKIENLDSLLNDKTYQIKEVQTTKMIEGRILGYGQDLKAGDIVDKFDKTVIEVAKRMDTATNVDNGLVKYCNKISTTTGPDGVNAELLTEAGQGGTDLGIPFTLNDGRIMLLFGDTFSAEKMGGFWNSNFMAITTDKDLTDGLNFDSVVTNKLGMIKPFAQGKHESGSLEDVDREITKIPTGGISVNGNNYIFYMSIHYWAPWSIAYNQCLKATDDTFTEWNEVEGLRWNKSELSNAGQIYPFLNPQEPNYVYFTSIPAGRNGGAILFRVLKENFENKNEYEYLVGPETYLKGDAGIKEINENPYYIINPGAGEPSIMYSKYLNKRLYSTCKNGGISFLLADKAEGPYNEQYLAVTNDSPFINFYGGFVHEAFTDTDGQRIYIQLSEYNPIYNTSLVEVVLE